MRQGIDLAFQIGLGAERFAVVEVGAAIPLAVPGMQLDVFLQLAGVAEAAIGKGQVAARAGQPGKLRQHVVEEERQPDAFAAPRVPHAVHAVVPVAAPHQRQSVLAEFQAALDGDHAVLVERRRQFGAVREVVVSLFLPLDRTGLEEGNHLVEHPGVGDARNVAAGDVGQPEEVVGEMGPHAAPRRRMPPMLHVAFAELMGGGAEQMRAREGRLGMHQRQDVLQLVAESVSAAGLVESRPAPEPAAQGLVEQPAVRHDVHRGVGRIHVYGAERAVPVVPDSFQRDAAGVRAAKALDQILHVGGTAPDPEAETRFLFLSGREVEGHLQRAARVEGRADLAGQPGALQRRRLPVGPVPAQEFLAVAGDGAGRIVDVDEGDPAGKFGVVVVAGQQGAGLEVQLRLHVQQVFLPQVAQHPFPIAGDRHAARAPGDVAQFQDGELHRGVDRHIDPQFRGEAVLGVFEHGVAKAVANHIGRRAARRGGRGRPELARVLVANVEGLARGVLHRIVAPGGQPELMGIFDPRVGTATFRDDRAKRGIGQHIDPRRGRGLARLQRDDIFVSVAGKAAEAILKHELPGHDRRGQVGRGGAGGRQRRDHRVEHTAMLELLRQRAFFVVEDDPGHGLQQYEVFVGNLLEVPDKNAAGLVEHLRLEARGDQAGDPVVERLAVDRNVLVENDQFGGQPLHAPVGVRPDELLHELDLLRVADAEENERRVAREAVAPETVLAAPVGEQHAGAGPPGGVGIDQRSGQTAVELGLRLRGVEVAQGHLAVRPREVEGAVGHAGTLIFFHLRQRGLPVFGHAENQINDGGFMGRQRHRAAQGDDGIEDGADRVGQGRDGLHRGGIRQRAAAPHKPGAIGFAGDFALLAALAHHEMQQPRRLFLRGPGAAGTEEGGGVLREFRFHEQTAEGGVRRVRGRRRQHDLRVAGQFNAAHAGRPVGDRDAP